MSTDMPQIVPKTEPAKGRLRITELPPPPIAVDVLLLRQTQVNERGVPDSPLHD